MRSLLQVFFALSLLGAGESACAAEPRVKVALVGMAHGHVNGWLRRDYQEEFELVGEITDLALVTLTP